MSSYAKTLTTLAERLSDEQCKALIEMVTVFSLGDSFTANEVEEIRQAMAADDSEYVDFEL
jgi:Ca2+-binding EF-hand superfamily protein